MKIKPILWPFLIIVTLAVIFSLFGIINSRSFHPALIIMYCVSKNPTFELLDSCNVEQYNSHIKSHYFILYPNATYADSNLTVCKKRIQFNMSKFSYLVTYRAKLESVAIYPLERFILSKGWYYSHPELIEVDQSKSKYYIYKVNHPKLGMQK